MQLYEATLEELKAHPEYRGRLTRRTRCIRLDFAGDFHMDVLPARTDHSANGDGRIEIPDRELRDWVSSNPKGYAKWFEQRAEAARSAYMESLGLGVHVPTHAEKPVLNRAIQLWKRRRDVQYQGTQHAPRSIIMTTIAARNYGGETEVADALLGILERTRKEIDREAPSRIKVLNPTNSAEDFGEKWDGTSYRALTRFVNQCVQDVHSIMGASGLPRLVDLLRQLFGVDLADRAFNRYRAEMREGAEGTSPPLTVLPGVGLLTSRVPQSMPVPRSTHFGD
jgi:hypothetical protein